MAIEFAFFDLGDTLVGSSANWLPGAKELLADLRRSQVVLGIISNTEQLTRAQVLQRMPHDFELGTFKASLILFSSEIQLKKPDPDIFQLAVQRTGVAASKCLFCTESLVDSLAAEREGMVACRVQKPPHSDIGEVLTTLQTLQFIA